MGSCCFVGADFQFGRMKKFCRWMVGMATQQCDCAECLAIHLKLVIVVQCPNLKGKKFFEVLGMFMKRS